MSFFSSLVPLSGGKVGTPEETLSQAELEEQVGLLGRVEEGMEVETSVVGGWR